MAVIKDHAAIGHLLQFRDLQSVYKDGLALARQGEDELVDLRLRAHVDALRGVVHQQYVGVGVEPAGEDDLLLVAAA